MIAKLSNTAMLSGVYTISTMEQCTTKKVGGEVFAGT